MKTANKLFYALAFAIFSFPLCNGAAQVAQQTQIEQEATDKLTEQKEFLAECINIDLMLAKIAGCTLDSFLAFGIGDLTTKNSPDNYKKIKLFGSVITICIINASIATWIQKKIIPDVTNYSSGYFQTLLRYLLHNRNFMNKLSLKKTFMVFEKMPEKLPAQAIELLKTIDSKTIATMTPKEIAEVCQQLRTMAEITK